jgi:hypothetical protein
MISKNGSLNLHLAYIVPAVSFLILFALINSPFYLQNSGLLNFALSFDLLISIPIFYFLLIRKTKIPKTTVVPILIISLVIGSLMLPAENQYFLEAFKTWMLPFIEMTVVTIIILKVRKVSKRYNALKDAENDFFSVFKRVALEIMPPIAANPLTTEISTFYYGFFSWKKRPLRQNEFSYHKRSGSLSIYGILIMIITVEAVAVHFLLDMWSSTAAWIFTFLSFYSLITILGIAKSIPRRPIRITRNALVLRYGILQEVTIPLENIDELKTDNFKNIESVNLSPLGEIEKPNAVLCLKQEAELINMYGFKKSFKNIGLKLDEPDSFRFQLSEKISSI